MPAQNNSYHFLLKFFNLMIAKYFVIGMFNELYSLPQQSCKTNSYSLLMKSSALPVTASLGSI